MEHELVVGAVARGWCHPENGKKTMDEDLAMAIVEEVEKALDEEEPTTVEERALVILTGLLEPLVRLDLEQVRLISVGMKEMDEDQTNLGTEIGEMLQRACIILEEFQKIEQATVD